MRILLTLITALSFTFSFAQSKEEMIEQAPMDSVIQYPGEGVLLKGNCLFIKFTGNAQQFFNELAKFHVQDDDQIERTKNSLTIYDTAKPFWVYGKYTVYADLLELEDYTLIEIYFKAYSNPENYRIVNANNSYQEIVNRLLGK